MLECETHVSTNLTLHHGIDHQRPEVGAYIAEVAALRVTQNCIARTDVTLPQDAAEAALLRQRRARSRS